MFGHNENYNDNGCPFKLPKKKLLNKEKMLLEVSCRVGRHKTEKKAFK